MILHAESEFTKKLADALGVDKWRRIIIDIAYDSVATIYVETFLDEEKLALLNLDAGFVFAPPKHVVMQHNVKKVDDWKERLDDSVSSSGEVSFELKIGDNNDE